MEKLRTAIEPLSSAPVLPSWWQPLFDTAFNASAFLSPAWVATWLTSYGNAFAGEWVSFWRGNSCVAGCLLMMRQAKVGPFPVRLAVINTAAEEAEESPWIEYNDVLCNRGCEDEVASAMQDVLRERQWDQLYLSGYVEDGVMSRLSRSVAQSVLESERKPSPYVDLSRLTGGADTLLSSNSRAQIKRSIKLYAQRGAVRVAAAETLLEAHAFLRDLARLHREGWKRRDKDGGFRTERFLDFHRRLVDALWNQGGVVLLRASAGDQPIGYLYNYVHGGKVYFYQSGFAYEEDPKLKPGMVAHCLAIDYFRQLGMKEYDFMAGDARYKSSLANGTRTLEWAYVERFTARMQVIRMARAVKRRFASARPSTHADTGE